MANLRPRSRALLPIVAATGTLAVAGVGLAVAAHMARNVIHDLPMTAALGGELRMLQTSAGRVACYVAGTSRRGRAPMLLIHSVNAAASSYEMRPLFDHFARTRRVVALDLPGFGFSDRADRDYSPGLYRDAIVEVLAALFRGEAADVVALSLGCEFAALAALQSRARVRTLTMISPSGLDPSRQTPRVSERALAWLRTSRASQILYDLLTSRPVLAYFLRATRKQGFDQSLVDQAYTTSHQPYASIAPFHFVTGALFSPRMAERYAELTQKILIVSGQDGFTGIGLANHLLNQPNWRIASFPQCGALVHWDDPDGVAAQIEQHVG